jgi:hypothetical protein
VITTLTILNCYARLGYTNKDNAQNQNKMLRTSNKRLQKFKANMDSTESS